MFILVPVLPYTAAYLFRDCEQASFFLGDKNFIEETCKQQRTFKGLKQAIPDYKIIECENRHELKEEIEKISKYLKWPSFDLILYNRMKPVPPGEDFNVVCIYKIQNNHSVTIIPNHSR